MTGFVSVVVLRECSSLVSDCASSVFVCVCVCVSVFVLGEWLRLSVFVLGDCLC